MCSEKGYLVMLVYVLMSVQKCDEVFLMNRNVSCKIVVVTLCGRSMPRPHLVAVVRSRWFALSTEGVAIAAAHLPW